MALYPSQRLEAHIKHFQCNQLYSKVQANKMQTNLRKLKMAIIWNWFHCTSYTPIYDQSPSTEDKEYVHCVWTAYIYSVPTVRDSELNKQVSFLTVYTSKGTQFNTF